jgi:1-phosphofructokinase family hexose kinase
VKEAGTFVCVSANPAIDNRLRVQKLAPGRVNRALQSLPAPGGKAAHVAMVLRELGAEPLWVGIAGGASGQALVEGLQQLKIHTRPVPIRNATRINLEIIDDDGVVTEILEPGPAVGPAESNLFQKTCNDLFSDSRGRVMAILSGSVPPGMPQETYFQFIETVHKSGGKAFLDTSADPLKIALRAKPDFVKPNREEAEWLTGRAITDLSSAAGAIRQLISAGAQSVAVSLGESGLVWCPAESATIYYAHPLQVQVRSSVGCGDATTAAFAYAAASGLSPEESLCLAAACGAANCLAEAPGRVKAADIQRFQKEVRIEVCS